MMATTTEKPSQSQQLLPPELRSEKKPKPVYGKKAPVVLKVAPPKKRKKRPNIIARQAKRLDFDLKRVAAGKLSARVALGLKLEDAPLFAGMSAAYLRKGDTKVALAAAETAIVADPNLVEAWVAKANALATDGEENLAIEAYRQALVRDPSHMVSHVHLADIYIRHLDYSKAALELQTAVSLDPEAKTPAGVRAQFLIAQTLQQLEKRK